MPETLGRLGHLKRSKFLNEGRIDRRFEQYSRARGNLQRGRVTMAAREGGNRVQRVAMRLGNVSYRKSRRDTTARANVPRPGLLYPGQGYTVPRPRLYLDQAKAVPRPGPGPGPGPGTPRTRYPVHPRTHHPVPSTRVPTTPGTHYPHYPSCPERRVMAPVH